MSNLRVIWWGLAAFAAMQGSARAELDSLVDKNHLPVEVTLPKETTMPERLGAAIVEFAAGFRLPEPGQSLARQLDRPVPRTIVDCFLRAAVNEGALQVAGETVIAAPAIIPDHVVKAASQAFSITTGWWEGKILAKSDYGLGMTKLVGDTATAHLRMGGAMNNVGDEFIWSPGSVYTVFTKAVHGKETKTLKHWEVSWTMMGKEKGVEVVRYGLHIPDASFPEVKPVAVSAYWGGHALVGKAPLTAKDLQPFLKKEPAVGTFCRTRF